MSDPRKGLHNLIKALKGMTSFDNTPVQDEQVVEIEQKEETLIKAFKEEERISVEIIAEPYTPDAHGDWYSEETIVKGAADFDEVWKEGGLPMNLFHLRDVGTDQLELIKHYVMPCECTVGETKVKAGTWIAEVKWSESLWPLRTVPREDGTLEVAGLSIKGWGGRNPSED